MIQRTTAKRNPAVASLPGNIHRVGKWPAAYAVEHPIAGGDVYVDFFHNPDEALGWALRRSRDWHRCDVYGRGKVLMAQFANGALVGIGGESLNYRAPKGRKKNPGFSLSDARALLDKQLTESLGAGWGTFSGETRQMPSGAWRIGVLYPKSGRWYWTIWPNGRLKGEHSLGGSRDPKKWTSGHKNPRKPGSLTAKGAEALLREARKADRLADSVARELGEHHATTQGYRAEAESYRRRAGLRAKGVRKNPGASHFLVILQELPPGDVWRASSKDKVVASLEAAKKVAQRFADDYVDAQAKSDWRYRAAAYPSDARGEALSDRAVLTVYPSKARHAAKDKANRIDEATRRHDYTTLAKLQGWGRKPRQPKAR